MRAFPAALERLTEQFARLPGIGMKSAQRLAFYVLSLPKEDADSFAQAIVDAKNSVRLCPVCQNLTDQELCGVCADPERDHSLICVVAEPKDVIAMERAREYHGVYHVLHGVISPLSHVGPDDLRIRELISRVSQGGVREVIMATNPDTEGEATAMYLSRAPDGREGDAAGLWHPRGQPAGVCRRGDAAARPGGQTGNISIISEPSARTAGGSCT